MIRDAEFVRVIDSSLTLDPNKVSFDLNGTYMRITDDSEYQIARAEVIPNARALALELRSQGFDLSAYTAAFFTRVDQLFDFNPEAMDIFSEFYTRESLLNRNAPPNSAPAIGRAYLRERQSYGDPVAAKWVRVVLASDLAPENDTIIQNAARNRDKIPAITGAMRFFDDSGKIRQLAEPLPRVTVIKPSRIPSGLANLRQFIAETFTRE